MLKIYHSKTVFLIIDLNTRQSQFYAPLLNCTSRSINTFLGVRSEMYWGEQLEVLRRDQLTARLTKIS